MVRGMLACGYKNLKNQIINSCKRKEQNGGRAAAAAALITAMRYWFRNLTLPIATTVQGPAASGVTGGDTALVSS